MTKRITEDGRKAPKIHVESPATSLVLREEMQMETKMRHRYTPTGMAKIQTTTMTTKPGKKSSHGM